MRFASSTSRSSVVPFARRALAPRTTVASGGQNQILELFGACLMIASFLVMALFG